MHLTHEEKPSRLISFIGLDMAWRIDGNHSGIAVMVGNANQVHLQTISTDVTSMTGVVNFVAAHASADAVVAIDASLVVKNATGQRECERMITRRFGSFHAGCHASDLGHPHTATGGHVVDELEKRGFEHAFVVTDVKERRGKWIFWVYPHPAMIRLFGLDRIIRYKKGRVSEKRDGLLVLRQHLQKLADGSRGLVTSPKLIEVLECCLTTLRGEALKRHEDTLDAIFCAYLAWHCWRWGAERNEMFGTLADGYIVVPRAVP
jgi:predicted RNase H-like nuclease